MLARRQREFGLGMNENCMQLPLNLKMKNSPTNSNQSTGKENSSDSYVQSSMIAKDALGFVGKFRTPPTPENFELWYRFVEGANSTLCTEVIKLMRSNKAISQYDMETIRQSFLKQPSPGEELASKVGDGITTEVTQLLSLVDKQLAASQKFANNLGSANEKLGSASGDSDVVRQCIDLLMESNKNVNEEFSKVESQLQSSKQQIQTLQAELVVAQRIAMQDGLTGLGNRRYFDVAMEKALTNPARNASEQYLMLTDCDLFKRINDEYGHSVGDDALKFVATALKKYGKSASIARFGGDEFAMLIELPDRAAAQNLAESIRDFFAENRFVSRSTNQELSALTISIGMARLRPGDSSVEWMDRTDKLLYSAKRSGGNCAMIER